MDRMYDTGFRAVCHFAHIVPAATMYASALMLVARLHEDDGELNIVPWIVFACSVGVLAQTHQRTFSAVKFGRIASIMALPSVIRLMNDCTADTAGLLAFQNKLKLVAAEYVARTSLVAFALAVGYTGPEKERRDLEAVGSGDDSPPWFDDQSIRSNSRYCPSSKLVSTHFVGPQGTGMLSEVSSVCLKYMGPNSRSSSLPSETCSDISLHSDPNRVDLAKAFWLQMQAQIATKGYPGEDLETLPQHIHADGS